MSAHDFRLINLKGFRVAFIILFLAYALFSFTIGVPNQGLCDFQMLGKIIDTVLKSLASF